MSVNSGLIARIRKILARTEEAGCTPAEAEAAYGLASNLMAKHNLDQGEVGRASGLAGEGWADEAVFETARWSGDLDRAAGILVTFFFVQPYRSYRAGPDGRELSSLVIFGSPTNVETARFIFNSLMAALGRLWKDHRKSPGVGRSDRGAFSLGLFMGFSDKLHAEREAMKQERDRAERPGTTALALRAVDGRTFAAFEGTHANLTTARRPRFPRSLSGGSFNVGLEAGRNLNLSRPVGGTGGPLALSKE